MNPGPCMSQKQGHKEESSMASHTWLQPRTVRTEVDLGPAKVSLVLQVVDGQREDQLVLTSGHGQTSSPQDTLVAAC